MEKKDSLRFEAQAQILKALAHPTRLFIAEELGKGERFVSELTDLVGADPSTVSKHLLIMKHAGIVEFEKRGTNMYYTLKMKCVLNFFSCVNQILQKRADEQIRLV